MMLPLEEAEAKRTINLLTTALQNILACVLAAVDNPTEELREAIAAGKRALAQLAGERQ